MDPTTTQRLARAHSERDIVRIVRDYVGEWTPEDLARLPESCRPGKMSDGIDICSFAYVLAKARFSAESEEVEAQLVQLESFFAQACARAAQLLAVDEASAAADATVKE